MRKIVYDEKYHAEALLEILEMENPCGFCPKHHGHKGRFNKYINSIKDRHNKDMDACWFCLGFVGSLRNCPCCELGREEAIKRTWIALEEKGYI